MSKLYASVGGDGRAKQQNRQAQTETFAAARSFEGSIIARIWVASDGTHRATIEVVEGSAVDGRELWSGALEDLIGAKRIEIEKGGAS